MFQENTDKRCSFLYIKKSLWSWGRGAFLEFCVNNMFIILQEDVLVGQPIDPKTKEVMFNPKYDQLFTPEVSSYWYNFVHKEMLVRQPGFNRSEH